MTLSITYTYFIKKSSGRNPAGNHTIILHIYIAENYLVKLLF